MMKITESDEEMHLTLDDYARAGAQRMLQAALDAEVEAYLEVHKNARDEGGRALVVRNGNARSRKVTCGAGTLDVQMKRINYKRVDDNGKRERFTSAILPPDRRRSPKVSEVLPVLYLRGLSTGDFRPALGELLGEDASGLSSTNIARLTESWTKEYEQFRFQSLKEKSATTSMCGRMASTSTFVSRTTAFAHW